jgi:hypothetical protein
MSNSNETDAFEADLTSGLAAFNFFLWEWGNFSTVFLTTIQIKSFVFMWFFCINIIKLNQYFF